MEPMWEAMNCPDVTADPFYADFTEKREPKVRHVWASGIPFTKKEEEQYGNRN